MDSKNILTIAYLNVHDQTTFTESKQAQIEDYIKFNNIDIAHLHYQKRHPY